MNPELRDDLKTQNIKCTHCKKDFVIAGTKLCAAKTVKCAFCNEIIIKRDALQ